MRFFRRGGAQLARIDGLDPRADCVEIARLSYRYEFPFDHQRATELALVRTFAIPSISRILVQSGEFIARTQKRFDDTEILLTNLVEKGFEHPDGKLVIRKMNRMHRRFDIDNDDYLYVLSTFVAEPVRWNRRHGYRPMSRNEIEGLFHFWREVGRRMAIDQLPATAEEMLEWNDAYERENMVYAEENRAVCEPVLDALLAKVPHALRPRAHQLVLSTFDDRLLAALGYLRPPARLRALASAAIRARNRVDARLPHREPRLMSDVPRPSYPEGFELQDVGADRHGAFDSRDP